MLPIAEATSYDREMKGDAGLKSSSSRTGETMVSFYKLLQNNGLKIYYQVVWKGDAGHMPDLQWNVL